MRVYALSSDEADFLGFEDGGPMLDLTRAIAYYDVTSGSANDNTFIAIEELIDEGRMNAAFLGEVMERLQKDGLRSEFTVEKGYRIAPPLIPGKIIALGQNYLAHIKEMGHAVPEKPVLFGKWPSAIIGQGDPIVKPSWIGRMDYEAELAVVIGSLAKRVAKEDAMRYVAGYTCLNDVTARDMQAIDIAASLPWMPSKNFDTFAPLGPCVLLAGVVEEPVTIPVQCRVNGKLCQDGVTSDFIFDIPTMIAYISSIMTLQPGDIITTGTPHGVGPLMPGDEVSVTCGGVGTLTNPVIADDAD